MVNGVYPTDAANQVQYLITDSGTAYYFAEDEEQLDKVLAVRDNTPTLRYVFVFDMEGLRNFSDSQVMSFAALLDLGRAYASEHPEAWAASLAAAQGSDLMTLTYTSGTTGPPKGAMISQQNMLYMMRSLQTIYGIEPSDEQLGFLPLAHVAGRMFYTFASIESTCVINLVESLETAAADQQEIAPTVHFAVPRVWEKQYSAVAIKMQEATPLGRACYRWALAVGEQAAAKRKALSPLGASIGLRYAIADWLVLRNVRKFLGIDRCRWLSTAAAPIAPDLIDWFWALGRPMYEVYGQTECTGLATANTPQAFRIGSVGKANPGAQVTLSEAGEILIRSPGVIAGYWNKPEKTAETIVDGWLHTGDVGRIDDDGYVYVVDRMKDIIITAGGKNITPSEIENQLKFSPYVSGRRGDWGQAPLPDLSRHDRPGQRDQVCTRPERALYQLHQLVSHPGGARPHWRRD